MSANIYPGWQIVIGIADRRAVWVKIDKMLAAAAGQAGDGFLLRLA